MFSVDQRVALRQIIDHAEEAHEVTACALLGSAARGEADARSDIDIALQRAPGLDLPEPAAEVHRPSAELSERMAAARASSLDAGEQERSLDATLVLYGRRSPVIERSPTRSTSGSTRPAPLGRPEITSGISDLETVDACL